MGSGLGLAIAKTSSMHTGEKFWQKTRRLG